jgi:hypothetical protein
MDAEYFRDAQWEITKYSRHSLKGGEENHILKEATELKRCWNGPLGVNFRLYNDNNNKI